MYRNKLNASPARVNLWISDVPFFSISFRLCAPRRRMVGIWWRNRCRAYTVPYPPASGLCPWAPGVCANFECTRKSSTWLLIDVSAAFVVSLTDIFSAEKCSSAPSLHSGWVVLHRTSRSQTESWIWIILSTVIDCRTQVGDGNGRHALCGRCIWIIEELSYYDVLIQSNINYQLGKAVLRDYHSHYGIYVLNMVLAHDTWRFHWS